jgi:ribosomal-protein-alanine N-acetyltransferase
MNASQAASGPRLEVGEGFHLSRTHRGDKAAYLEHLADPEIYRRTLAIPFPYTEADADWWIDHREQNARDPEAHFAIREPGGQLIGAVGVVADLPPGAHCAEIGYWLAKPYRNRGVMTRVLRTYAGYAFAELGLRRLWASPFDGNAASARVLEKAGFQREGCLREHCRKDGQYLDALVYGLLASEF